VTIVDRGTGPGQLSAGGAVGRPHDASDGGLLTARDLTVRVAFGRRRVPVVDGVGLRVGHGEIVGLVGETGCGKSMTALAILGLLPRVARPSGSIRLAGRELIGLPERELREIRGAHIGYVAQDATAALNPVLTVRTQLTEIIRAHAAVPRPEASDRATELLRSVGIAEPRARLAAYPHQLSGGMRQRVAIAIALACNPQLVVADEPTTALDATVQAQIIDLLLSAAGSRRASVVLISHDLQLVGAVASRVYVMYAGRIVEENLAREVMRSPMHPYTRALLQSTPRISGERARRLQAIEGRPPDPRAMPPGCRFHPRCPVGRPECTQREPMLGSVSPQAACWFPVTAAPDPARTAETAQ
jgi:oligopeptide/dipeptide ABC transporter ATP-binding protein